LTVSVTFVSVTFVSVFAGVFAPSFEVDALGVQPPNPSNTVPTAMRNERADVVFTGSW
jgi:hypothetical protein